MKESIVILVLLLSMGMVMGLPMDYLVVEEGYPKVSPSGEARTEDPIAIDLMLRKKGVEPEEAWLNLSLEIDNPRVEVTYDSEVKRFTEEKNIELKLPSGIQKVKITIRGNAPEVYRLTQIQALETRMYVYFDEYNKGYIKIPKGGVTLEVTNPISPSKSAIEDANSVIAGGKEKGFEMMDGSTNSKDFAPTTNNFYIYGGVVALLAAMVPLSKGTKWYIAKRREKKEKYESEKAEAIKELEELIGER